MARLYYVTESVAEALVTRLTERVFPGSPAFQLRGEAGRNALLSALAQPHWPYYRTLPEKAGAHHYSLNKNHPFADGNKRFALMAMGVFLLMNDAVLVAGSGEAEAFALGVADGSIDKDASIAFVRRRTLRLGWTAERVGAAIRRLPEDERETVLSELRNPTSRFRVALPRESA